MFISLKQMTELSYACFCNPVYNGECIKRSKYYKGISNQLFLISLRLFRGTKDVVNKAKAEKLKTILHYFKRVTTDSKLVILSFLLQILILSI